MIFLHFNLSVRRLIAWISLVFLTYSVFFNRSCHASDGESNVEDLLEEFRDAERHFDNDFFKVSTHDVSTKAKLYMGRDTLSFVISPLLLELMLMTISLGATGNTLKELHTGMFLYMTKEEKKQTIQHIMKSLAKSDLNLKLEIFNMMFVDESVKVTPAFQEISRDLFNMSISHVDFSDVTKSRINVNNLIAQRSKRKMEEIFDDSDFSPNGTSVVLVSSLYFKNKWLYPPTVLNGTYPFRRKDLAEQNFTMIRMFRINGMMMYGDIPDLDAQVVEIQYATPDISMIIFLPKTLGDLLAMEEKLMAHQDILRYLDNKLIKKPLAVSLPKFALEAAVLLPAKVKAMGINKIWEEGAELGRMLEKKGLFINHAVQRIKLWGDQGRGAFKDTGDEELPKPEVTIFADHPFFFIIKMLNMSFMMGHFLV